MGSKATNLAVATSIADPATRKSIEQIISMLQGNPLLNFSGRVVEVTHTKSDGSYIAMHGLGFVPRDIVLLSSGLSNVTIYDSESTDEYIKYGVSISSTVKEAVVRLLVGTFGGR